jgi:hypothetical protein
MQRAREHGYTLLAITFLAACSSSADLGSFKSSLDGQDVLGQLTPAQDRTLCDELTSFASSSGFERDSEEAVCRATGVLGIALTVDASATDAEVRAACKTAYDACRAGWDSGVCNAPDPACTATVAELTACMNDGFRYIEMELKSLLTCDQLTAAMVRQEAQQQAGQGSAPPASTAPQSCQDYELKCPVGPMPMM